MKTILELQEMAARLRAITEVNSISPENTFGLVAEVLSYLADLEQNVHGLGIHQVYVSVAAMETAADGEDGPVGSDGRVLRFGQLVTVFDAANAEQRENGNVYAWQGADVVVPWKLVGNISDIGSMMALMEDEEDARAEADAEIRASVALLVQGASEALARIVALEGSADSLQQADENQQQSIANVSESVQNLGQATAGLNADVSALASRTSALEQQSGTHEARNASHQPIRFFAITDDDVTLQEVPVDWNMTENDFQNVYYSSLLQCFFVLFYRPRQEMMVFDAGELWNDPKTGHPYMEKLYLMNGNVYVYTANGLMKVGGEERKVYLTQAEYDELVAEGEVDENTEYNIYEDEEVLA